MVQVKDLTKRTLKDRWEEVKNQKLFWEGAKKETLERVMKLLNDALEEEMVAELEARRYERRAERRGYRNGYRERSLLTRWGALEKLRVPRDRDGQFQPQVLERYQRREEQVNEAVRELFLRGISTRKIREAIEPLLGKGVSAQTVSRICLSLQEEVEAYHRRLLVDTYQYLFFDGVALKVKSADKAKKRLLLCAYGITVTGTPHLIDFRQATAESEAQWEAFLSNLYRRGLEGKPLQLITIDGCPGLKAALEIVYPYVDVQRCWVHKLRNVAGKLPRKDQERCLSGAKAIYLASTRREAVKEFRLWAEEWSDVAPAAVDWIERDLDELLSFLKCPSEHRRKVRTTNAIERAFREVRRRTRPMSCFQNKDSVDRIIFGVISHLNQAWRENPLEFTHLS